MKYLILSISLLFSVTSWAGVGSFALGYVVGKSGSKKNTYTNKYTPSELEELRNKVVGRPFESGWAFDFNESKMTTVVNVSGYNKDLVLKLLNDLQNDGYPVSLSKKQELVFDWKKEYCSEHEVKKDMKYLTLLKRVADVSRNQVYTFFQCPFFQKLSNLQRYELLGEDFETGSYLIGGGSWVGYQFEYEKSSTSFKNIESKTDFLKQMAEKYCNMKFKDTTSKILSHIFPLKEKYLIKSTNNYKIQDLKFSYKKICGKS